VYIAKDEAVLLMGWLLVTRVNCGQTPVQIEMPLGMTVDLG